MRVLITGGTGFIGRYVVKRLANNRAMVRVPTRHVDTASFLLPMGEVGQIAPIECRVQDDAALAKAVASSTDVVNLIGILHEPRKGDFETVQGRLPGRIGEAAKAAGVQRFVQISAIGADPAWITTEGELRTLPYYLTLDPPEFSGMDGFYVACLRRSI